MNGSRIAAVVLVTIGLQLAALAESRRIASGAVSAGKFVFHYETHLDPSVPELANVGGGYVNDSRGTVRRFMVDRERLLYFGYTASIDALPEPGMYRVTFSELSLPPETMKSAPFSGVSGWRQLRTPGWEDATVRTVRAGEVLALTLLSNDATGQKIIDYVTVQEPAPAPTFNTVRVPTREFRYATGAPRDFQAQDAELTIQHPRVSINGRVHPATSSAEGAARGSVIWFYLPSYGRVVLTLAPREDLGFRKAGEIRGSAMTFTLDGGNRVELVSGGPIAPGDGVFNVYVLHDPRWRPTYAFANPYAFTMGAGMPAD